MNNNDILNKYIDLIDKGYCCACNELNCIDNFPQTKITHAIKKLQQENKQLKDNWDELKEWLEKKWEVSQDIWFVKIINKMKELEKLSK